MARNNVYVLQNLITLSQQNYNLINSNYQTKSSISQSRKKQFHGSRSRGSKETSNAAPNTILPIYHIE